MRYEFVSDENDFVGWGKHPVIVGKETYFQWFSHVYNAYDFNIIKSEIVFKVYRLHYHDTEPKDYYADDYYMYCIYQFLEKLAT